MNHDTTDRVYGCLVGGAIGDALGAPVEGWTYARIREEYGEMDEFVAYNMPYSEGHPGAVTDDATLRQYLALAVVHAGGRVTPEEYAEVLCERLDEDRVWVTEEITLRKLLVGVDPWRCGEGNIPGAAPTSAATVNGIVNLGDPRQAYQDGYDIAAVHQSGVEAGAAATVAAGTATALRPSATVDDVVATMLEQAPSRLYRAMDLVLETAEAAADVAEFVERFYERHLDWRWPGTVWDRERYHAGKIFSGSTIESLPAAVGLLHLCGEDANRALVAGASFGRDCDTIASLVGSLSGAVEGADAIRQDLVDRVETANRSLFRGVDTSSEPGFRWTATQLVDVLASERARHRERADRLATLL